MKAQPILMYTTQICPFCSRARQLLVMKGWTYQEIPVDGDPFKKAEMVEKSGRETVPQIWIGSTHIGGCDELLELERSGQLDEIVLGGSYE